MGILDRLFGCCEDYEEAKESGDLEKFKQALEEKDAVEREIDDI